jgi:hypothetical protein
MIHHVMKFYLGTLSRKGINGGGVKGQVMIVPIIVGLRVCVVRWVVV